MMDDILISIVIPLYNKEEYIGRCLDSIFCQNNEHIEIIVVDDGSTDKGCNIVENYKYNNLRLIRKKNGGVSSARNRGIQEAKGNWIIFMDADDYFLNDAFLILFNSIHKYEDYYVLIADFKTINENGNETSSIKYKSDKIISCPLKALWYRNFYSRPGNTVIRKDAFDIVGKYDEHISYNEDLEFSIRLLSYYKPVILSKKIMAYVKTPGSASSFSHPYEKDFVSRIPYHSLNSKWEKLLTYNVCQFYKKNNKNSRHKNNLNNSYPLYFNLTYIYHLIIRKIYLLFIK